MAFFKEMPIIRHYMYTKPRLMMAIMMAPIPKMPNVVALVVNDYDENDNDVDVEGGT